MKCRCINMIIGVHSAFGSIHHTFHTSLNISCFVQGRKNRKWKQTWLLSGALALRNQITAEKPETEISVITSVGVILMKPWKVASFQGLWGEIRSDFSAFFPMDKQISIVNPAHTVCQGLLSQWRSRPGSCLMPHLGPAQHPNIDLSQGNQSQQGYFGTFSWRPQWSCISIMYFLFFILYIFSQLCWLMSHFLACFTMAWLYLWSLGLPKSSITWFVKLLQFLN